MPFLVLDWMRCRGKRQRKEGGLNLALHGKLMIKCVMVQQVKMGTVVMCARSDQARAGEVAQPLKPRLHNQTYKK